MSVHYQAVNWNPQKRIYDLILAGSVLVSLAGFTAISLARPDATLETALIRSLGLTALVLLHVILVIGPLARLDRRFLPLLYNRRHLGVTMALLALGHAAFATLQYHGGGGVNPIVSLLQGAPTTRFPGEFPFEYLGLAALVVVLLMAATSHDFWLSVLTPSVWKSLHMLVYAAYGLLLLHVGLGEVQTGGGPAVPGLLLGGAGVVFGLHLAAGIREWRRDRLPPPSRDGWVEVCGVDQIAEGRAVGALVGGERIAVFRHQGKLSGVSGVCRHQNGPLSEGRIIDGCITCPWHGYQYRPEDGRSPPPYDDRIATYHLQIRQGRVFVLETPDPPGTRVEPLDISRFDELTSARPAPGSGELRGASPAMVESSHRQTDLPPDAGDEFYVGYLTAAPARLARFLRGRVSLLLAASLVVVLVIAWNQDPPARARFEYGLVQPIGGVVFERPYPLLFTPESSGTRTWLLAAEYKRGADSLTAGHHGRMVRTEATRIYRGSVGMLELHRLAAGDSALPIRIEQHDLGEVTLRGEVVDSKCWSGAMNPGEGPTHRLCALRCLRGGLPPLLSGRDTGGDTVTALLVGPGGVRIDSLLFPVIAAPVEITGRLRSIGTLLVLEADPTSLRRVSP